MVSNISKAIRRGCEESLATGKIEGRREGIAEGMLKGKIEGKVETALKMLAKGFALDLVLEITGLSPEQLTETKKNEEETQ